MENVQPDHVMNSREFDAQVRSRMPLVDWVIEEYGAETPLQGWKVLFIQHQLENHLAQAEGVLELGVSTEDLFWVDIPYTSSLEIREAVQALNVPEENFDTHQYNLSLRYGDFQRNRLVDWIENFRQEYGLDVPLLVLDDGGYFLEAMVCFRAHFNKLAVVEQTTRGMMKYRENDAIRFYCSDVPLINVAESKPKKKIEAKFIAEAVTGSIEEKLEGLLPKINIDALDGDILILGYGDIGRAVAKEMLSYFRLKPQQIAVYDTSWRKRNEAKAEGFAIWSRQDFLRTFKLVIGCTGKQSFNVWNYVHLAPESVLISASSGSSELAREEFVEFANSSENDHVRVIDEELLPSASIHSDISLEIVHHTVVLANGGWPINFSARSLNQIPAEKIQVTVAMMLYAALQAIATQEKGPIPLNPVFCARLTRKYNTLDS